MPISIRALRPSYPAFAGEVSGIDITRPIGREDIAAIEAGMDTYAVLVFRGQDLTDEQQLAFTLNFGELEHYKIPGHIRKREDSRLGPGIADFSNLDKDGHIMSPEDRVWFFKLGDHLWHSDSSFRPVPAKYSLLSARSIPSNAGLWNVRIRRVPAELSAWRRSRRSEEKPTDSGLLSERSIGAGALFGDCCA